MPEQVKFMAFAVKTSYKAAQNGPDADPVEIWPSGGGKHWPNPGGP